MEEEVCPFRRPSLRADQQQLCMHHKHNKYRVSLQSHLLGLKPKPSLLLEYTSKPCFQQVLRSFLGGPNHVLAPPDADFLLCSISLRWVCQCCAMQYAVKPTVQQLGTPFSTHVAACIAQLCRICTAMCARQFSEFRPHLHSQLT